jgi:hypothetical protein
MINLKPNLIRIIVRSYAVEGEIGGIWAGSARPNTPFSDQLRKS